MSFLKIPYEEMKKSMILEIKKHEWGYLATSDGEKIRVGKMRLVSDGLRLWCFTLDKSRKYKQILVYPKVAIADGNLQVEGVAELKGHPYDDENADFLKAYKETQPENFERTSRRSFNRPNTRVIEINPERIAVYGASNKMLTQIAEQYPESDSEIFLVEATENYYDILNLRTKQAHRGITSQEKHEEIWDSKAYNE
jgi:general stress protein 26